LKETEGEKEEGRERERERERERKEKRGGQTVAVWAINLFRGSISRFAS
jgi:hypothetical protein